jgi:hypothetical protein
MVWSQGELQDKLRWKSSEGHYYSNYLRKWKEALFEASFLSFIGNRRSLCRFTYHTYLIVPCDEEVVVERIEGLYILHK